MIQAWFRAARRPVWKQREGEVCGKSQGPGYLGGFVGRSCKAFDSYWVKWEPLTGDGGGDGGVVVDNFKCEPFNLTRAAQGFF